VTNTFISINDDAESFGCKFRNENEIFRPMNDYSEMVGWKFRNEPATVSSLTVAAERDCWIMN
jgi:hypothetical protein